MNPFKHYAKHRLIRIYRKYIRRMQAFGAKHPEWAEQVAGGIADAERRIRELENN